VCISRTVCITIIPKFRTYIPRAFRSGADCAEIFEQSIPARQATQAGEIDSIDSCAGILEQFMKARNELE
jgi:hypothetical protein